MRLPRKETMGPIFIVPAALIVPVAVIRSLQTITGDPLSAVFLALILFITVAARFAGSSTTPARAKRSRG